MNLKMGWSLDGLSFSLCSIFCFCIFFRQEQFWVKKFWDGWVASFFNWGPCLSTEGRLYKFCLCWVFQLMSSSLGQRCLSNPWHLELSSSSHGSPPPTLLHISIHSPGSLESSFFPYLILFSLHSTKSFPPSASHNYFVPPSKWDWSIYTLAFLPVKLHKVWELYQGYSEPLV